MSVMCDAPTLPILSALAAEQNRRHHAGVLRVGIRGIIVRLQFGRLRAAEMAMQCSLRNSGLDRTVEQHSHLHSRKRGPVEAELLS